MKRIHFLLPLLLFFSCGIQQHLPKNDAQWSGFKRLENPAGSFTVYHQHISPTKKQPYPLLIVKVFNYDTQQVIFEKELRDGKIAWQSDYMLILDFTPAILSKDPKENIDRYILDVKTGEIIRTNKSLLKKR